MIKLMCFVGAVALINGAILCGWGIAKVMDWRYERKETKRKKAHPYLFELVRERNALASKNGVLYHDEIAPRRRQIDFIMKEMNYFPDDVKASKQVELAQLKNELYEATMEEAVVEEQIIKLRQKIADYVDAYNLEWAKERGWGE